MQTKIDKNQVVSEMISTETSYNEALTLIELGLGNEEIVGGSAFLAQLKPSISALKIISDKLLENGHTGINLDITDEQHTSLRVQRTQLLKAFFEAYKIYAELFNSYVAENSADPKQFERIDKFMRLHSKNNLNFEFHLIMPVQRGPRYSILISAIKENDKHLLSENHDEFEEVGKLIKELLTSINSKINTPSKTDQYWFGKYTYEFLFGDSTPKASPAPASSSTASQEPQRSYQFGDYTRSAFSSLKNTFFTPSSSDTTTNSNPSNNPTQSEIDEFVMLPDTSGNKIPGR